MRNSNVEVWEVKVRLHGGKSVNGLIPTSNSFSRLSKVMRITWHPLICSPHAHQHAGFLLRAIRKLCSIYICEWALLFKPIFWSHLVFLLPEVVQSDVLHCTVAAQLTAKHFLEHFDEVHVVLWIHCIVMIEV